MYKTFKVAQVRDLLNQLNNEEITISRFVEILNEQVDRNFNSAVALEDTTNTDKNGNYANLLLCAENVVCGVKYELTYVPIEWNCPFCKTENSTTLILEEDLNYSQDNFDTCRKCKNKITLKASAIFCT